MPEFTYAESDNAIVLEMLQQMDDDKLRYEHDRIWTLYESGSGSEDFNYRLYLTLIAQEAERRGIEL